MKRLILLLVGFGAVMAVVGSLTSALAGTGVGSLVVGVGGAIGALWLYRRVIGRLEQRPVTEVAWTGRGLLTGSLLGLGLFTVTFALIAMFGGVESLGWGSFVAFLAAVGINVGAAVTEEIVFRAVLFRIVQERWGTRVALAVSAVLFGLLHLVNKGATVWGAIAIAIEAGLMLGAAYALTRNLWFPIGLHFGWNMAEGGLFGTTVSGSTNHGGLLHSVLDGPAALTGGSFGPEASVFAILACGIPAVLFLRIARRRALAPA
ncbi:CPBP family intramembrane glutamic endopeptidase [Cryptosporangium phraense]|uniref:CPBP family intramembrane metalloprotease n=1 Tax=Cryptosporangium phraense TaxID=2593070 RepID=A0A545AMG2_9ACTN|nr:type II CAAX endopeptidase family protein [Cryptosporangium phraense]TQS42502.1 CPBP family intramembrane metalloprotease [Cryptosporangium phraense]